MHKRTNRGDAPEQPVLITVEHVAALLNVGRSTAWRLVGRGAFKTVRIGRSPRILRSSVDEWLQSALAGQQPE